MDGLVLVRLGALLSRETFLGLGGTVGGLGWWGGERHLWGLWDPGGLTGLVGLSELLLLFRCRSTTRINHTNKTLRIIIVIIIGTFRYLSQDQKVLMKLFSTNPEIKVTILTCFPQFQWDNQ